MKFQGSVKIISRQELVEDVFRIRIEKPENMEAVKPGQFFNFKVDTMLLRRPISVSGIYEHELEFTIKTLGKGTEELSRLRVNENVDLMGPLGNGFDIKLPKRILLLGGGIGVAPIKGLGEYFMGSEVEIHTILGFRDAPYAIPEFEKISKSLTVVSENDSNFRGGYITEPLKEMLEENGDKYDMIYACGPSVMLKNVQKICSQFDKPVQLLMEEKMACGIGACLVCTCKTKEGDFGFKHSRMCIEGPMFYGDEVIFDE